MSRFGDGYVRFKAVKLWQILSCRVLGSVLGSYLAKSVCTYRKQILRLETTQKLKSHVMAWLLVFEAKLTNMVSM